MRLRAASRPAPSAAIHGDIDPATVGLGFEVEVMIELTHRDRATVADFEWRIARMDAVTDCRRLFGVPDYLVHVAVADAAADEAFSELPGIGRVTSEVTLKLVKAGR
jgi:Lrp/AsnC family leucine-responsive transcriptional regulator